MWSMLRSCTLCWACHPLVLGHAATEMRRVPVLVLVLVLQPVVTVTVTPLVPRHSGKQA